MEKNEDYVNLSSSLLKEINITESLEKTLLEERLKYKGNLMALEEKWNQVKSSDANGEPRFHNPVNDRTKE